MDFLNLFDKQIAALNGKINTPIGMTDALIFVHDTLDLCITSAHTLFKDKFTPEIVFEIYDRVVSRLEKRRMELEKDLQEEESDL